MSLNVVQIYPQDQSTGLARNISVSALFDCEIDEDIISSGGFVIATTAKNLLAVGPVTGSYDFGSDPLNSTQFQGIVDGSFTFERIELDSLDEYTGDDDYTGDGSLWRTKVSFTPSTPFDRATTYTVLISNGTSTRTIFSVAESITGTGGLRITGPYTGSTEETVVLTIVESGARGTARFSYHTTSHPDESSLIFTSRSKQELFDGVYVSFDSGDYEVGDTFTFALKPQETLSDIYGWSFTTVDSYEATPPEDDPAQTLIDSILNGSTRVDGISYSPEFYVVDCDPENGEAFLQLDTDTITITFNTDIDSDTIDHTTVYLSVSAVDGSPDTETSVIDNDDVGLTVNGEKLTIYFGGSESLLENNIISVVLSPSIQSTDGVSLAEYEYYFVTMLDPLYNYPENVYLQIGSIIGMNFSEDIIFRFLYKYSKEADVLNFSSVDDTLTTKAVLYWKYIRAEWVLCKTLYALLYNIYSAGTSKSKKLGDFAIEFDSARLLKAIDEAKHCIDELTPQLKFGGTVEGKNFIGAVPGAYDPDRAIIGRGITNALDNGTYPWVDTDVYFRIDSDYVGSRWSRRRKGKSI